MKINSVNKVYAYSVALFVLSMIVIFKLSKDYDFSSLFHFDLRFAFIVLFFSIASLFTWILCVKGIFEALGERAVSLKKISFVCLTAFVGGVVTFRAAGVGARTFLYRDFLGIKLEKATGCLGIEILLRYFIESLLVLLWIFMFMSRPVFIKCVFIYCIGIAVFIYLMQRKWSIDFERSNNIFKNFLIFSLKAKEQAARADKLKIISVFGLMVLADIFQAFAFYFLFYPKGYHLNLINLMMSNAVCFVATVFSFMPLGLGLFDLSFINLMIRQGVMRNDVLDALIIYRLLGNGVMIGLAWAAVSVTSSRLFRFSNKKET